MAMPADAQYDYTRRKWVILVLTPTGNGYVEADGPPPEQLEQARKNAKAYRKHRSTPEWWEEA
jgi:hypothetical protein